MRSTAMDRLSRNPAKTFGSAAGSTTMPSHHARGVRSERAVSTWTRSRERTPSTVLSRIGHTVANTIVATCMRVPIPNRTRKTGIRAGGGMARANANNGPT
jgi:hypothetical protein